jgi:hypothetical protein
MLGANAFRFRAAGHGDGRRADQVAGRREGGGIGGRGIDAHLRTLTQQIADEAIERLVRAIAHIIIIAAEQRDTKSGNIHRGPLDQTGEKPKEPEQVSGILLRLTGKAGRHDCP